FHPDPQHAGLDRRVVRAGRHRRGAAVPVAGASPRAGGQAGRAARAVVRHGAPAPLDRRGKPAHSTPTVVQTIARGAAAMSHTRSVPALCLAIALLLPAPAFAQAAALPVATPEDIQKEFEAVPCDD